MIDQSTLWLQYLQALNSKVQLGAGEAMQAIYPFKSWDWGGRDPLANSFSYEEWMALNIVPSNPLQNSNSGAAASQSGFDTAYSNWFDMLAIGDLAKDQNYQQLQDHLNQSLTKYTTDYGNAQNQWKNQTGGTTPDFNTWLADPAQFAVQTQLNEDHDDVTGKQGELDDYRSRIQGPVNAIVAAFNNSNYQGNITDPNSGKSVPVRLWNTDPVNPFTYVTEITGNNFGGDASKGKADSLSLSASSETYEYSKFYTTGDTGAWDDFIGVFANGSYEKIDWSQASDEYTVAISWQDLGTVTVTPDAWFAGANITSYGKGPYATGFSAFNDGSDNYFFGPGGALSRIYTKMIVAYRPTITITAGNSFASYLYSKWEAEAGVEIGPFFFGGKTEQVNQQSTASVNNGQFIIQSQSDWPMVIGLVSAWTLPPQ